MKLKFFYSTMRSGKSTQALQIAHNFELCDIDCVLMSCTADSIESRLGIKREAIHITDETQVIDIIAPLICNNSDVNCPINIIIDEAQFLTPRQVEDLASLIDKGLISIYAFGLLTDFQGELFQGTKRIIELADEIQEIEVKSLCHCGKKAVMNMRVLNGIPTFDGEVQEVGEDYVTLCRKHYFQLRGEFYDDKER